MTNLIPVLDLREALIFGGYFCFVCENKHNWVSPLKLAARGQGGGVILWKPSPGLQRSAEGLLWKLDPPESGQERRKKKFFPGFFAFPFEGRYFFSHHLYCSPVFLCCELSLCSQKEAEFIRCSVWYSDSGTKPVLWWMLLWADNVMAGSFWRACKGGRRENSVILTSQKPISFQE